MPSFSHIFMLYPLSCKDILETTTLTLATSTPQQNNRRPLFFCAMRHEARGARNGAWLLAGPAGVTHPSRESPKVSSSPPMTCGAKPIRVPWCHSHGQLKNTLAKIISENIGVMEKRTFFFVSLVKLQHLRIQFHLGWWNGSFNPFSINWVKWNSCRTYYICLLSKSVFWAQTEPNSYLLLGERKPKVTCFYIHFSKTNEKQSNQKKDPKTLPLPYDIFHFPIFFTEMSRNSRILSSQAADDLSCLFFLLIPEMMSSIPGSRLGALEKQRVTKRWNGVDMAANAFYTINSHESWRMVLFQIYWLLHQND